MIRDIAIILAAGESRRMGQPKALVAAGRGHTFVSQLAERCRRAGLMPLVVTGAHAKEIRAAYPKLWQVENRKWKKGQLSSVLIGLRACALARRVIIHPVDAPDVSVTTFKKLMKAKVPCAVASFRGKAGHPVSVDGTTARALLRTKAKTLAEALERVGAERVPVKDRAVLENINRPGETKKRR